MSSNLLDLIAFWPGTSFSFGFLAETIWFLSKTPLYLKKFTLTGFLWTLEQKLVCKPFTHQQAWGAFPQLHPAFLTKTTLCVDETISLLSSSSHSPGRRHQFNGKFSCLSHFEQHLREKKRASPPSCQEEESKKSLTNFQADITETEYNVFLNAAYCNSKNLTKSSA